MKTNFPFNFKDNAHDCFIVTPRVSINQIK